MPEAPGVCARMIPIPRDSGGDADRCRIWLHRHRPKIAAFVYLPLNLPLGPSDHPPDQRERHPNCALQESLWRYREQRPSGRLFFGDLWQALLNI